MSDSNNGVGDIVAEFEDNAPQANEDVITELNRQTEGSDGRENLGSSGTDTTSSSSPSGDSGNTTFRFSEPPVDTHSGFDPAIHCSNPDGTPKLTKTGKFRFRRGSKAGFKHATVAGGTVGQPVTGSQPNFAQTASFLVELTFSGFKFIGGEVWEPTPSERSNITDAATKYCAAKNVQDLPPGVALVMAFGMYAALRITHEDSKLTINSIKEALGFAPPPKPVKNQAENHNGTGVVGGVPQNNGNLYVNKADALKQFER